MTELNSCSVQVAAVTGKCLVIYEIADSQKPTHYAVNLVREFNFIDTLCLPIDLVDVTWLHAHTNEASFGIDCLTGHAHKRHPIPPNRCLI